MKQPMPNLRLTVLYYLLLTNVIIFVLVFSRTLVESTLICFSLILGSTTSIAGIWTTVQYVRGKRDQPMFLGPSLIFVGSGTIVLFLSIIVALFRSTAL